MPTTTQNLASQGFALVDSAGALQALAPNQDAANFMRDAFGWSVVRIPSDATPTVNVTLPDTWNGREGTIPGFAWTTRRDAELRHGDLILHFASERDREGWLESGWSRIMSPGGGIVVADSVTGTLSSYEQRTGRRIAILRAVAPAAPTTTRRRSSTE